MSLKRVQQPTKKVPVASIIASGLFIKGEKMEILVTASFGLEAVVKRELEKMGYQNPKAIDGKVHFSGDMKDLMKVNMSCRAGDRVLLKLAEFKALSFDELFNQISKIPFEKYIKKDAKVRMDGNCVKSKLGAIKTTGGVIKKAIMQRLSRVYGEFLYEQGEPITVVFNIVDDVVTISLDSSGDGLHKRGYRVLNYTAPLKETMGAGLIMLTYYNKSKVFADPFCGSGTLPIEACLYALNIAPNKNRKFAFFNFVEFNETDYNAVKKELEEAEIKDFCPTIYASDINPEAIKLAKVHAKNAGVEKYINFSVADMKDFSSNVEYGVMVSNPPYGDRIGEKETIGNLYTDFGKMASKLPNWNVYVLTDNKNLEHYFAKSADKKRKLYNANIECTYYSFLSQKPKEHTPTR